MENLLLRPHKLRLVERNKILHFIKEVLEILLLLLKNHLFFKD